MHTHGTLTHRCRLIHRLVLGTIQTGSATSAIAIMTMVAYYIGKNETNGASILLFPDLRFPR
jgi:hypothetical protein